MSVPVLLLATHNPGKAREFARLLPGLAARWRTLADLPGFRPPPEDGATFADNARAKAVAAARASGLPAIADDSGLCVDALGGAPGVRSARYAGPGASDAARRQRLLAELSAVPPEDRGAAFECALAAALPDGRAGVVVGRCRGRLLQAERGTGGFGYDPVFVPDGESRTFAEMAAEEKDALSHRGQAAARLPELLASLLLPGR